MLTDEKKGGTDDAVFQDHQRSRPGLCFTHRHVIAQKKLLLVFFGSRRWISTCNRSHLHNDKGLKGWGISSSIAKTSAFAQLSLSSRGPAWLKNHREAQEGSSGWSFARNWEEENHLQSKTKSFLVGAPDYSVTTIDEKASRDVLSRSYSIQTLRTQVIDFAAPKEAIKNAISSSADRDIFDKGIAGRLLDVIPISSSRKASGDEEVGHAKLLILHVSGKKQNELVATIVSAPKYTRHRSEAAFTDYDYLISRSASREPVTSGMLREHARLREEEEAEERAQEDGVESQETEDLQSERIPLHKFPSKICSIDFAPPTPSFGYVHSGPWVCIQTVSSTVFASVELSSKKEQLLGYSKFRLVSLLEILHGESILSSGVASKRIHGNQIFSDRDKIVKSRYPIVDVRFHPDRYTTALTVDSKGNVGVFDCDLLSVKETSWNNAVSWAVKHSTKSSEGTQEVRWMIEWTEDDDVVVLASPSEVQSLSMQSGNRSIIYTCLDASITSMTRSLQLSEAVLWIATTTSILLYDLRAESVLQRLLSWQHNRSHTGQLQLSAVTCIGASAVSLSSQSDRMLSLFSATIDPSKSQGATWGEPSPLATSLSTGISHACGPIFLNIADLNPLWHKWIKRNSRSTSSTFERDHLMIEMGNDGSLWVKVVNWSTITASQTTASSRLPIDAIPKPEISRLSVPEITAERSLHSLSAVYRVLMSDLTSSDQTLVRQSVSILSLAGRWLQEQDVPMETMLLPQNILELCSEDSATCDSQHSSLLRLPLLPMSIAVESAVQNLLKDFLSSTFNDAWTIDLHKLISSQLHATVPSTLTLNTDNVSNLSETLMKTYMPRHAVTSKGRPSISEVALRKLKDKMLNCCREVEWDLLLSSLVISMRPVVVQTMEGLDQEEEDGEQERVEVDQSSRAVQRTPPYHFSFFTPRPAPSMDLGRGTTPDHGKKSPVSKAARWLLSEWQVGSNPHDYLFQHPYKDMDGERMSESEANHSLSDTEQRSMERHRSNSTRSMSVLGPNERELSSQMISSQRLPPTIGSTASQPILAPIPSHLISQLNLSHSQPTTSSAFSQATPRIRPRKRRAGGF